MSEDHESRRKSKRRSVTDDEDEEAETETEETEAEKRHEKPRGPRGDGTSHDRKGTEDEKAAEGKEESPRYGKA